MSTNPDQPPRMDVATLTRQVTFPPGCEPTLADMEAGAEANRRYLEQHFPALAVARQMAQRDGR
jgi:hypothetical protein